MGNQPLGDDEPQMPRHGNVTAQFLSAQHSEKSFRRKKNVVSGLQGGGTQGTDLVGKRRVTHPFRVISIQAKTAKGSHHLNNCAALPGKSQNSELLEQY